MKRAWERGLCFTIGRSSSTAQRESVAMMSLSEVAGLVVHLNDFKSCQTVAGIGLSLRSDAARRTTGAGDTVSSPLRGTSANPCERLADRARLAAAAITETQNKSEREEQNTDTNQFW